jgi:hypothetical protein
MAMTKTKRRKSASPIKTRPTVELFREFFLARMKESAAAWSERMPVHTYTNARPTDDQLEPEPPEVGPSEHTWTKDDERARMRHRQALAAWPTADNRNAGETWNN